MKNSLDRLIEQARPAERAQLLLRVILMDDATAAAAWREWSAAREESTLSPAELRLLPSAAQRLTQLRVSSELPKEFATARRNTFVANQARLMAARALLERLCAEMPIMLLKGGARIAADPMAAHLRIIRDIDVLFMPEDLTRALEIAVASGYRSTNGWLPGAVKSTQLAPLFIAGEFKPDHMEVDFHVMPLRFGRSGYHDTELWQRAVDSKLIGLHVKVPSVSDRFLHAIAHGLIADDDKPTDWILDSAIALQDPTFDKKVVASEIFRRRLGFPVAVASALLGELGIKMPDSVLSACNRDLSNPLFRRELSATIKRRKSQTLADRILLNAAEWQRSVRSRRRIRSWKTSWVMAPSLRRPGMAWTEFTAGRAEVSVDNVGNGRLTLRFSGVARHLERPSFDILLEDLWIGQVRFRLAHKLALKPPPSWKVQMTFRHPAGRNLPNPARLTVVALDKQKIPTASASRDIRVTAETA